LAARTKDLDGDGAIDITSIYREGRLGERRIEELRMAPGDS
jgi:hypothetical protein